MKTYILNIFSLVVAFTFFVGVTALADEKAIPADEPTIKIEVNGLVCDFCAQAVTKVFKKQDEVIDIDVNLSDKMISVWLQKGKDIADDRLTQLIIDSGYNVVKIMRGPSS